VCVYVCNFNEFQYSKCLRTLCRKSTNILYMNVLSQNLSIPYTVIPVPLKYRLYL